MINTRDHVLRDPAHLRLILGSLLLAYLMALLPWGGLLLNLQPDWLLLVLLHWWLREPWRVGQGAAFAGGLLMDLAQTGVLGVHALAYSVVAWATLRLRVRLLSFSPLGQVLQILPLLLLARLLATGAALMSGGGIPSWTYFLGGLTDVLAWIPITLLLHHFDLTRSNPRS